jgi:hypothetical protein
LTKALGKYSLWKVFAFFGKVARFLIILMTDSYSLRMAFKSFGDDEDDGDVMVLKDDEDLIDPDDEDLDGEDLEDSEEDEGDSEGFEREDMN